MSSKDETLIELLERRFVDADGYIKWDDQVKGLIAAYQLPESGTESAPADKTEALTRDQIVKLFLIASYDSYNIHDSDDNAFLSEIQKIIFPDRQHPSPPKGMEVVDG